MPLSLTASLRRMDDVVADAAVDLPVELGGAASGNPPLARGGAGERALAELLGPRLTRAGFEVEVVPAAGAVDRPSLLATARGRGGGRSLVLNGHLDTVGVHGMPEPFAGTIDGDRRTGRLRGRGACDMKAGVAAMIAAAEAVAARRPAGGGARAPGGRARWCCPWSPTGRTRASAPRPCCAGSGTARGTGCPTPASSASRAGS